MSLGGDTVDYIMSRISDQSKSRRQVMRQLVQLGLIGSAKELKKFRSQLNCYIFTYLLYTYTNFKVLQQLSQSGQLFNSGDHRCQTVIRDRH